MFVFLTCVFHHLRESFFLIYNVHIPRKYTESRHSCSCFLSHPECQAEFLKNLFPSTAETSGNNYNLLYHNSIRKDEVDLDRL